MSDTAEGGSGIQGAGRELGVVALTALVVGNMVGSGVFLLPANLAPYGGASFLGWLVSAGGSILLGLCFARLARRSPAAAGPYAYTRDAFGEFPAFLVGWGYWISCWAAVASIATAMVGYLGALVEPLRESSQLGAAVAIGTIVLLTGVNCLGVREAGFVQVLTTILKLLPLVAIALFGFTRFDSANLEPFVPAGSSLAASVIPCVALTLWAFQGLECAAVASGTARDARRDVPRATIYGIVLAAVLYVACTLAVMGLVPREQLASSEAPFADAARVLWGAGAGKLVAFGAFVSCFGALNGWILVTAQMPLGIARDSLFPAFFGRTSARDTPVQGLVVSSALACLLVVFAKSNSEGLTDMFESMILIATLAALIPYSFCSAAELAIGLRERRSAGRTALSAGTTIALLGFAYSLLAISGVSAPEVKLGFLLLLVGVPFFVLARNRRAEHER